MRTERHLYSWINLLRSRANTYPDRPAYIFVSGKKRSESLITYQELNQKARKLAAGFQQYTKPMDRILILLPSGHDYITTFFAAIYAGCIPVTADKIRFSRQTVRAKSIISDCSPALLITDNNTNSLDKLKKQLNFTGKILNINSLSKNHSHHIYRPIICKPNDIAFLQYTSGSTSSPKGVMITHENLTHNCQLLCEGMNFNSESIVASWLPFHHDMGLIGKILCSLYAAVPCYFMSPIDFIKSPYLWLKMVSDYKCTISGAPNFAFDLCIDRVSEEEKSTLDLSHWSVAWNGAEPVRYSTIDNFFNTFSSTGFKRSSLHPCYGLAEGTLFVSSKNVAEEPLKLDIDTKLLGEGKFQAVNDKNTKSISYTSIGFPRSDTDVKIVDTETLTECPDGVIGEIWTSSSSVAKGYWKKTEDTESIFFAKIENNGKTNYLRTGDLAARVNGQLFITGRTKDVFILNGQNIYPQDIEYSIEISDINIAKSAVFSTKKNDETLTICAICELNKKTSNNELLSPSNIVSKVKEQVQLNHEISLSNVCLVHKGEIPKTTSGKIQRLATKEAYLNKKLRVIHDHKYNDLNTEKSINRFDKDAESIQGFLTSHISRLTKTLPDNININDTISSLGLSSIHIHEITHQLESIMNQSIDIDLLYKANPTIEEISQRLTEKNNTEDIITAKKNDNNNSRNIKSTKKQLNTSQIVKNKFQQQVHNKDHAFIRSINPEFGRKLSQLKLDKEYVKAEGINLFDKDGNIYLDFLSQYGSLPLGHNHPDIWSAVMDVYQHSLPSMVQPSFLKLASQLADKLVDLSPGDIAHTTFCNSGAEAVEAAIKLARSTTGRIKILSTIDGFHGKTLGALSATGREKYRKNFGVSNAFEHIPYNDIDALENALAPREYAAFIVEPIQGEAGVIMPHKDYLLKAQELCHENGTLFIADEVQTGIGRTGNIFYSEELGLEPDIITIAKGLGGGLTAIGACLSTHQVYNDEFGNKHTSTFAGNGLACAVGMKTLDLLLDNNGEMLDHVNDVGTKLKRALLSLQRRYPQLVKDVRGTGLMLGLHIDIDRYRFGSGLLASVSDEEFITSLLMSYMLNHEKVRVAFTLNNGNVLRIQPPLTVTWNECLSLVKALENTFTALETRNMGTMIGHLVDLKKSDIPNSPLYKKDFLSSKSSESKSTFGFLLHPLTPHTYVDFDISLQGFTTSQLAHIGQIFGDNFDSFLGGETKLMSDTGEMIDGQFWIVPRTAHDLMIMPKTQALQEVQQSMDSAIDAGAKIIGLGAYTSTVTQGGILLDKPDNITITTGNAFTSVVGFMSIVEALSKTGNNLQNSSVSIIGATGAIGRAMALQLAPFVKTLYLIGNSSNHDFSIKRLNKIAQEIINDRDPVAMDFLKTKGPLRLSLEELNNEDTIDEKLEKMINTGSLVITTDWEVGLADSNIIVTTTNSPNASINSDKIKPGAIICDISRPSNVSKQLKSERPDIFSYDGGVVKLPSDCELGLHTDLAPGLSYACMAETMLIALEGRKDIASLGIDINMSYLPIYWALAEKHGFRIHLPEREKDNKNEYYKKLA